MTDLREHEGFLELLTTVDIKIQKKLIVKATDEEIESVLDCFANVEPFLYRLNKCKPTYNKFKKIFQKKNFTLKKARALFQRNVQFVASVVAVILSELLNRKVSTLLACQDEP